MRRSASTRTCSIAGDCLKPLAGRRLGRRRKRESEQERDNTLRALGEGEGAVDDVGVPAPRVHLAPVFAVRGLVISVQCLQVGVECLELSV